MQPGPRPQPSAVKRLRGLPGHRALNVAEPQPGVATAADLKPPIQLGKKARRLFRELVTLLLPLRLLSPVDRHVLARAAVAQSNFYELTRQLEQTGWLTRSRNGITASPLFYMLESARRAAMNELSLLGLDPSSRSRLQTTPATDDDDDFLNSTGKYAPRRRTI